MKSMKTLCSLAFLAAKIAAGQEPSLFDSEYGRASIAFSSSSVSSHTNRFVTSTTDSGMVLISEKESGGSLNENNMRVCIGNVSVFVEGNQPLAAEISILRAGGVDIPDEPAPQNPGPEPGGC